MTTASMKFYTNVDFRQTDIGNIPLDWEIGKLGDADIADIIMGQSPPSATYNKNGDGLPFLQGKMEFGEIYPVPVVYCSKPLKVAEQNDVLLSVRAPVGDVNIAPYKLCIGRGLAAIRFNPKKAHFRFYFYYLKRIKNYLENLGKGSTFKAINREDLENLKIPVPPVVEQWAIVEVLSVVDLAIQKTDEVIAKTERLKKGLMQTLLTRGIGHKEYKETPIGKIPKTWHVISLGDVADFKNGLNFAKEQKGSRGILTVDVLNMYGKGIYLDFNNLYRVNIPAEVISEYLLEKGDILFVRSSLKREGVGWASLFNGWSEPVTFCGFIIRARLKTKNVLPEFLTYFLRSDIARDRLVAGSGQVAITNVTQEALKTLKIPIPPLEEQRKITSILSTVDEKIELEIHHKARIEKIKRGLMDLLLTGKVRIKVIE